MKISNETKVGLLTISGLTLLILGFNFLKGKDVFTHRKKIFAVFSDLGSLEKSNEVKINGLPIGKVYDFNARDKNVNGIVVTINLTKDLNIPKNSLGYISSGLVGASYIIIEKGDASVYMEPGDTLRTRNDNSILSDVKAQLNPTLGKLRATLDSLNVVFSNINKMLSSETKGNLQQILTNLNKASSSLNSILDNQNGALAKTLNNANSITENLKKNNDSITAVISNAKRFTEKLSGIQVQQTIDSIQAVVSQLRTTIAKLTNPNGTLGALINDRELYNKLNDAILSAETLMDDLRVHPKRYTGNIIFNRKDKTGPLTSPVKKDSIPK